jgi:hypothetical protein
VYRLLGHDAVVDDVVQETFLAALEHIGALRDPQAVRPWLASKGSASSSPGVRLDLYRHGGDSLQGISGCIPSPLPNSRPAPRNRSSRCFARLADCAATATRKNPRAYAPRGNSGDAGLTRDGPNRRPPVDASHGAARFRVNHALFKSAPHTDRAARSNSAR